MCEIFEALADGVYEWIFNSRVDVYLCSESINDLHWGSAVMPRASFSLLKTACCSKVAADVGSPIVIVGNYDAIIATIYEFNTLKV